MTHACNRPESSRRCHAEIAENASRHRGVGASGTGRPPRGPVHAEVLSEPPRYSLRVPILRGSEQLILIVLLERIVADLPQSYFERALVNSGNRLSGERHPRLALFSGSGTLWPRTPRSPALARRPCAPPAPARTASSPGRRQLCGNPKRLI